MAAGRRTAFLRVLVSQAVKIVPVILGRGAGIGHIVYDNLIHLLTPHVRSGKYILPYKILLYIIRHLHRLQIHGIRPLPSPEVIASAQTGAGAQYEHQQKCKEGHAFARTVPVFS